MLNGTIILAISLGKFTVKGSDGFFRVISINVSDWEKLTKEFKVQKSQELVGKNVALDVKKHRIYLVTDDKSGEGVPCSYGFA